MTERLLQYIWQFQYFNSRELSTSEGELLQVINPGIFNSNQGPDFTNAKIRVGKTSWAGSVEIHINSSDWRNHHHDNDINYRNVVLHVVWKEDACLSFPFPTLVLEDKVPKPLLHRYEELMKRAASIPCSSTIQQVKDITWISWKERLMVERLQTRTQIIKSYLQQNSFHWEETFWWLLAKNFGTPVNSEAFESMARSVPFSILTKHKNQIHQVEAILFGQSGLLEADFKEEYPGMLQREYRFLQRKYGLKKNVSRPVFLRMRPSGFPTLRLAQLAMLVHQSFHFFSKLKECDELADAGKLLEVTANDYWNYHYLFDEHSAYRVKKLGRQMIDSILINTAVPILFAYGHLQNDNGIRNKALRWLEGIPPEKNSITKGFESLRLPNRSAFDSQAYLQLKNEYCGKKRCLDCAVGSSLLRL